MAVAVAMAGSAAARPGRAHAQPAPGSGSGSGSVSASVSASVPAPATGPLLEIDDCKQIDLTKDEIFKQGSEHYERGETLYVQGDYEGAVRELVYSYCLVPSFYSLLKDIGQAYERNLDYEKAVGYLERYVREVPANARRTTDCATDPQQDKANVARRVEVLKKLRAKVYVESSPPGAQITISNPDGVAARAHSGDTIEVLGGHYDMVTELDGYAPHHQVLEVRIGKPYTYFVPLVALKGRLAMQVSPPDARIFLGDRLVGIGHIDVELDRNTYAVTTEAQGRVTDKRDVEILANQVKHVQVELPAQRQTGRRQAIVYSTIVGAGATASLLYAFQSTGLTGAGSVAGGVAGLVGSILFLPDDLPLGTSNLTITSSLGGGVLGAGAGLLFTRRQDVLEPLIGASVVIAGTAGYLVGGRTHINTGDAALINSGVIWGSVAGGLFAASFDPGHVVGGGLVLSGLGMGTIGGLLLERNYSISRTHAALIDVGGLIGIIGGLAAESLVYPQSASAGSSATIDARSQEHLANFALGGMAIGLIGAGIVTRNLDDPKIPVAPSITTATARDGSATPVYGLATRW
ncbi:MAG TPA: hypothetical protein VH165_32010 [Kofleriaceae bacterium]|jgi:hypothetical protein|nr:hypothetical protein [Kofleriaceae bacterium]